MEQLHLPGTETQTRTISVVIGNLYLGYGDLRGLVKVLDVLGDRLIVELVKDGTLHTVYCVADTSRGGE